MLGLNIAAIQEEEDESTRFKPPKQVLSPAQKLSLQGYLRQRKKYMTGQGYKDKLKAQCGAFVRGLKKPKTNEEKDDGE